MYFTGKYFNGKSSAGFDARISFNMGAIDIEYEDSLQQSFTEHWDVDKIHENDFASTERVLLKYAGYPHQYLEVNDSTFADALRNAYPAAKFHQSPYHFVFRSGIKGLFILSIVLAGLFALLYLFIIPAVAEHFATTIPIAWEKEIGDTFYDKLVSDETIDEANSKRMNAFFQQLHYKSNYDIEIAVVKNRTVNAFSLPGGKMVVYTGILRAINSPEELAALLSHEYSHVVLKHSTRNIFRSLSSYMFISILFGDASGISAVIIQNANKLKQLGYSRQLEEDADKNGLKLMEAEHINPIGMTNLFEALKKEEGEVGNVKVQEFLSTHPLTTARLNYVQKEIDKKDYTVKENPQLDSLWHSIKDNLDE